MKLIMTHENADFDAIASLLAAHKLYPDATPLLPRRINRNVEQFLTLYWDAFRFVRPSDWQRKRVDTVILVDTQALNSVRGMVRQPTVHVIDHHLDHQTQHEKWTYDVTAVGANTTQLVEQLQARGLTLTVEEATLLLLGIYEDTGSLTYDTTTPRDLAAAGWLLERGNMLGVVRRFLNIPLTEAQMALYEQLYTAVTWHTIQGQSIVLAGAVAPVEFREEISSIAHRLREALTPAGLFILVQMQSDVQLVARSTTDKVDVSVIARAFGGGGHDRAAAARIKDRTLAMVQAQLAGLLPSAVQPMVRVAQLMSYGLQIIRPEATVAEAAEMIRRFGYEGYPVVDEASKQIVGLLTRRAVDRALSHQMERLPVSRIMRAGNVTVRPSDSIADLQQIMLREGWGQIPVLPEEGSGLAAGPIGIVTRTDLLNHLFEPVNRVAEPDMRQLMLTQLPPQLWQMVQAVGEVAGALNLPLYFVGGIVRDMLLGQPPTDLDMVVEGEAIKLAFALQTKFGGEVHAHERFGTAKWMVTAEVWTAVWGQESVAVAVLDSIDFVTARTEFYTEPSALPEVTHGSIKLDLHRRDFSINTLAVRLDGAFLGQLLDFYGGQRDLALGVIRVLHSLSFVDDPTRILRAVRLEQRLHFTIEPRTTELIGSALPLLDRLSGSRIRHELELAFQEADPALVLARLAELGVLHQIDAQLCWREEMAAAFARLRPLLAHSAWRAALGDDSPAFVYFALWIVPLGEVVAEAVMERLRVRKMTRHDVQACGAALAALAALPPDAPVSAVEKVLRPYALRVLLVLRALVLDERLIYWLEQYYEQWRHVKTAVTGHTLRRMGLKPGPEFAVLLDALLAARLDGRITDEAGELALLQEMIKRDA
jgi:tRNA nucleotidyltransferase (CCA-adding enzyme)